MRKPPPPPPKKVTFADKKAGDKIVKILSRENPPSTKKQHHIEKWLKRNLTNIWKT